MKTNTHSRSYLTQFCSEWEIFQTKLWRKSKHAFYVQYLFRKSCRLWCNVEKYCRAGQATDDNAAHVHCLLDT